MKPTQKGADAETRAASYLERCGCTVIKRNYHVRGGEVDIIFSEGDTTVFCEVKARTRDRFGSPAEAVNITKRRRVCLAALDYAAKNKGVDEKYRFDIIEFDNGRINHIRNAFEFIEP